MRRLTIATVFALSAASAVGAQQDRASRFLDNCRRGRDDYAQFCEIREFSLPTMKGLVVDGRENGGISIHGWDRAEIKVIAMVQSQAENEGDASAIAKGVQISTTNGGIAASGPTRNSRRESWSVSYEIYAPKQIDLALSANNGGISVENVEGRMELETSNGGLSLNDVAGDVRGRTVNGGINAELTGDRWRGTGLDLKTSNGGVTIYLPTNYSARLETGTVNGGMNLGFPISVQGNLEGRRISTQLGGGGPTISATTTNGGVNIRRR
jgi:DUF4097 and DUF4098 domain-containing protein YvlB